MNRDKLSYRPCVAVALFNKDGLVFVGERIDTPGAWQMPQGGIEPGENLEAAALRELAEEIGTSKAEILKIAPEKTRYDIPEHVRATLPWGQEYRGQEQTWIAMRFTGADSDIRLDAHDPPEFSNWKWVRLEDTLDLIVPFKRDTYKQVIGFFKGIATC